jgi:RNA polymerase sigma-70 factor (ECF subfamily)
VRREERDARAVRMRAALESNAVDLLKYFGRRVAPSEDAADLLSETLVTVWRRIADLPGEEPQARMWMFGVARRVLANHRRGKLRYNNLAARLRENLISDFAAELPISDRHVVWDALDRLPAAQREVVLLVHGDGFTVTEAAKMMSSSASTTRTRYSTALRSLQGALEGLSISGSQP